MTFSKGERGKPNDTLKGGEGKPSDILKGGSLMIF